MHITEVCSEEPLLGQKMVPAKYGVIHSMKRSQVLNHNRHHSDRAIPAEIVMGTILEKHNPNIPEFLK